VKKIGTSASDKGDSTPCQVDSVSDFPILPIAPEKKKGKKKGSAKIESVETQAKAVSAEIVTPSVICTDHGLAPTLSQAQVVENIGSEDAAEEAQLASATQSSPDENTQGQNVEPDPAQNQAVGKNMMAVNTDNAEAVGYLSGDRGDRIQALSDAVDGDAGCTWPSYVFCQTTNAEASQGWLPKQVLWELYYDEAGREWITDEVLGEWRWVDELFA
jgi:hypothetical protein